MNSGHILLSTQSHQRIRAMVRPATMEIIQNHFLPKVKEYMK
jgi:hypothetical protein